MVPYLRLVLLHVWVASVAGAALIVGLAMGYYSVATFVLAGVIGLALGVPAALLNWAWLRPNRARQLGWSWPIARWIRAHTVWGNKGNRPGAAVYDDFRA